MSYPDRIDFRVLADRRVVVVKLRKNGSSDIPTRHEIKAADFDLDAALTWCEENGYTVRRWPGGARAWLGPKPRVIRTAYQIARLRAQLERELAFLRQRGRRGDIARRTHLMRLLQLDLAYYG